ncbi:unnamed protein product [Linum tenue]|uniref:Protein kinase domain-containing protein n=1 Tax=Linum tenue TaxID=586396 RepID=A0AAV0HPN8_9ROSI|nr:unnamed protein product [Linum tenue]CAI0387978.1 unnamed protein product [Linum tenue]
MGFVVTSRLLLQLVKLCAISLIFTIQGSTGFSISPTQRIENQLVGAVQSPVHQIRPFESNPPSSESHVNGPTTFDTPPESISGQAPSYQPSPVGSSPPYRTAPPPLVVSGNVPSESPTVSFTPIPQTIIAPSPENFEGNVAPLPSKANDGSVSLEPPLPSFAPPPQISGGNVAPLPPNSSEGHVAPMPSSSSGGSVLVGPPTHSIAPPPHQMSQGQAAPMPSNSSGGNVLGRPPAHSIAPPPQMSQGEAAPVPSNFNGGNVTLAPPPKSIVSPPQTSQGQPVPSPPSSSGGGVSLVPPPHNSIAPPPRNFERQVAPTPSNSPGKREPGEKAPAPMPVATPPANSPPSLPSIHPGVPEPSTGSAPQKNTTFNGSPLQKPVPAVALPPRILGREKPVQHPIAPAVIIPSVSPDPEVSSPSSTPPRTHWTKDGTPVTAPSAEIQKPLPVLPPTTHAPAKASFPAVAPSVHKAWRHSNKAPSPSSTSSHKHNNARNGSSIAPPKSSYVIPPHSSEEPALPPSSLPTSRPTHYASPPHHTGTNPVIGVPLAPSPSKTAASNWTTIPILSPKISPRSSSKNPMPLFPPIHALPPPPPNQDCSTTVCMEPYANTPPGSPCGCVLPMQVGLRLSVALYTFFPLVSEFAKELATGVFMKQSQVRIMGANAASQEPDKTIVLIDLVPLGQKFDNTTAFLTYQRFWLKQVAIQTSLFGDYQVLYVRYPGLPESPPSASSGITIIDDGPYSGNGNNARTIKPLGVDVSKRRQKDGLNGAVIAIIALSASIVVIFCSAVAWIFISRKRGHHGREPSPAPPPLRASVAKPSGISVSALGSGLSSHSLSFGSSIAPYTGSAKTFSASDIERATHNFDDSRTLGEGGFGRVYSGVLDDGTQVAVKVLKRDDQQSGREFLAEVEMLSRLHHRNLVKLIGICTEEHARCLVYELVPNGSVESHLHGDDKESAPLDWDVRIKIALGAARGLAYLHEDSSPRVIHRDFKSSNILLESDFTPKVSDFGLARSALDEETSHISTRVMGTFGYVAPEYAMTGHLLVKSDVYSYGVVLLELLSGRKPVDMSQPPGQENLVAWARPLLTSQEGLEMIIDPSLRHDVPFDSVAKVAAIASMCVQPEVSHRPFMGEVVQALKLVCNECDEAKEVGSISSSRDLSMDGGEARTTSGKLVPEMFHDRRLGLGPSNYDSDPDIERGLTLSDMFGTSGRFGRQAPTSASFRRYSSSGPLSSGKGREWWQRMRRLRGESVSEHGIMFKQWAGSY